MLVGELIAQLMEIPNKNLPVVLNGYEGGVSDVTTIEEVEIAVNVNQEWYYGEHEITNEHRQCPEHHKTRAIHVN